ncbi:anoctamin [Plakobranchus ocellatus]|uniref:Anoctamin n=1 Tax=Plakobranchus ocellatus TaxID=259542 RepID=A0AAV3YFC9_9GAST|nr:anoctamin [Plakobranchus ocellatus]
MSKQSDPGSGDFHLQPISHLSFSDVATIGASLHKTSKRHKRRMKNKTFGTFERRYSKLALNKSLVPERKRIDYVLIYPNISSKDAKDESKILELKKHEYNRARFENIVSAEGFSLQKDIIGENVFVKLHCPFKRLCVEAEKVKIEMALKDCPIPSSKPQNCFQTFADEYLDTDKDVTDFVSTAFVMNKIHLFEGWENPEYFFRPSIRSLLVHHILINVDIRTAAEVNQDAVDLDSDEEAGDDGLCCLFKRKTPDAVEKQESRSLKRRGLPYLLLKKTYTDSFILHDDSAKCREKEDSLSDHFLAPPGPQAPLDEDPRRVLDETWSKMTKFQPLWHIRNYFGEKIALYFAWSGMLITTLWVPMIFGIAVFIYGLYESLTADDVVATNTTDTSAITDVLGDVKEAFDNKVTPFFALFICCWGTVFLELWKRQKATLAYEWDVDQFEANEPDRPQFYGTRVKSDPVTSNEMWFYPFRRQLMKYTTSLSVLCLMVGLVIASVVGVIIYRVIMNVDYCPDISDNECLVLTTVISSILNAVSILILGKVYDMLAIWLTNWENHRTQTRYDDALIMKLFAFQFVNSYASCFYIAFFRGRGSIFRDRYVDDCEGSCMTQLSFQVLILMVAKPFPKFFKDIVIPFMLQLWRKRPNCCRCFCLPCCKPTNQVGQDDNYEEETDPENKVPPPHADHVGFLERERLKPDLGDFTLGEFTEKVILYGFLMLFASSFPLAPLLALIICYIDIRVDAKRMLWWYRRPVAYIAQDIGMWYGILNLVNFIGVLTNAFIIAFTSDWGSQFSTTGKLWVVIGFEHIVFFLKFVLAYLIPDVPQEVRLAIRRERYLIQKKFDDDSPKQKDIDFSELFPSSMTAREMITEEDEDDIEVKASTAVHHRRPPLGKPGNPELKSQFNQRVTTPEGLRNQRQSEDTVFHVSYQSAKPEQNATSEV